MLSVRNHGLTPTLKDVVVYEPGCSTYDLPLAATEGAGAAADRGPSAGADPSHRAVCHGRARRGAGLRAGLSGEPPATRSALLRRALGLALARRRSHAPRAPFRSWTRPSPSTRPSASTWVARRAWRPAPRPLLSAALSISLAFRSSMPADRNRNQRRLRLFLGRVFCPRARKMTGGPMAVSCAERPMSAAVSSLRMTKAMTRVGCREGPTTCEQGTHAPPR